MKQFFLVNLFGKQMYVYVSRVLERLYLGIDLILFNVVFFGILVMEFYLCFIELMLFGIQFGRLSFFFLYMRILGLQWGQRGWLFIIGWCRVEIIVQVWRFQLQFSVVIQQESRLVLRKKFLDDVVYIILQFYMLWVWRNKKYFLIIR